MALATSVLEALRDPEECEYAAALLRRGGGDLAFLRRYLAFLTDKGDPRAEALRLHLLLTAPLEDHDVPPASELRRALRAVLPHLSAEWWQCVAKPAEIYACGSVKDATPRVRFTFSCPNTWETLEPTSHDRRRFCTTCREHVHWADDLVRVAELARQGACISIPAALADQRRSDLAGSMTGRPDWRGMWAAQLFGPEPDDD